MGETELESLDELREYELYEEQDEEEHWDTGNHNEDEDQTEELDEPLELEEIEEAEVSLISEKSPRRPRKRKLVIPPNAHPLEVFMLTCEFKYEWGWGDLTGITKLSKETLLDIIRGDEPTEYERSRIRLTTGVKL